MLEIMITVLAILFVFFLWVILYDTHHFVVKNYSLTSPKIKKRTRLVMLSDLHNYRYGPDNAQLLNAIEVQNPDYVVIAGDMITADLHEKFGHTLDFVKNLQEKYPLYYAFGNHEQKIHILEKYREMAKNFDVGLKERNIVPFNNSHAYLADRGICLYGLYLDHEYFQRFHTKDMEEGYLASLLGACTADTYNVLLAHNPDYFLEYAKWGADLTLSGHVHGGIIRVPFLGGFISPAVRFFPKYDGGLFTEGDKHMVLGRGIGTHTPKVRLFNPAELVVVDLDTETR